MLLGHNTIVFIKVWLCQLCSSQNVYIHEGIYVLYGKQDCSQLKFKPLTELKEVTLLTTHRLVVAHNSNMYYTEHQTFSGQPPFPLNF